MPLFYHKIGGVKTYRTNFNGFAVRDNARRLFLSPVTVLHLFYMPLVKTSPSLAVRKATLEQRMKKLREKIGAVSKEFAQLQKQAQEITKGATLAKDAQKLAAVRKKLGLK